MIITVDDARKRVDNLRAAADALEHAADAAVVAGHTQFDTVDALSAEARASSDELQAALDGK